MTDIRAATDADLLSQFFGGAFNQDWHVDHDTEEDVVAAYRSDVGPDGADAVADAIERLLRRGLSENELAETIARYGCYCDPVGRDGTASAWLREVEGELRAETGA